MDTRKVTLVATIAVIALVAVGIGYAYTAITVNDNNSASSEYVELTQGSNGAYTFVKSGLTADLKTVYFDTKNVGPAPGTTTYILMNGGNTVETAPAIENIYYDTNKPFYGKHLGEQATIQAKYSGTTAPNSYPITISGLVNPGTGWYALIVFHNSTDGYQYALCDGTSWTYYSSTGSSQDAITITKDGARSILTTMDLYFCGKASGVNEYASATVAPTEQPFVDVSIKFTYTTNTTYTVTFTPSDNYTVKAIDYNGEKLLSSGAKVAAGTVIKIDATNTHSITSATYNDGSEHNITITENSGTFTMGTHDVTIAVTSS